MKKEQKNLDIPFLIFVAMLLVALIVTAVAMYIQGKDLPVIDNSPTPTPSVTPYETPSPTESEETELPTFSYSLPRVASTSLSAELSWDITIGGSGADVVCDVIGLDKLYIFGTTTSKDYDMACDGGSDLFVAVMEEDRLLSVVTFGTEKDDVCLFAKPCYGNYGTTFIVLSQSSSKSLDVFILPTNTMSALNKTLTFEHDVRYIKAFATSGSVIVLINEGDSAKLIEITSGGETREIPINKEGEGVDLLVMGNSAYVLAKLSQKDTVTEMMTVDLKGKTGTSCNIFSDKARLPLSITPDENGYFVQYKRVVDAKTVFGVMHLNKDLLIDFDHEVSGADYDEIKVFTDVGATKLKGYHIFCTKKTATGYKTTYENICTHGDLNDFSGELLENVLPIGTYSTKNGTVIIGDVMKEGKSNIYLAVMSNNFSLKEEHVFGGSGNDVAVTFVNTKNGDFLIVANTTSNDGDISNHFGRSDVLVIKYEK